MVPHITDAIQEWIERVSLIPVDGKEGSADVCVIELGGTIGKNELAFLFIENYSFCSVIDSHLCYGRGY